MRILKVISLLLDYPDQHLRDGHAELAQAIGSAREISPEQRIALRRLRKFAREGAADESLPDALPPFCSVRSRPPFGGRISGAGDAFGSTGGT